MICMECGYEIPYELMEEENLKSCTCQMCGNTNEAKEITCKSCPNKIPFSTVRLYNGKNVPCEECASTHNYNTDVSASFTVVPSIHDMLENEQTAMVPSSRKEQVSIAQQIQDALHREEPCIAEAGTGTGKTLAYLVPTLSMGKRVIVSTATKALQDQIVNEDGPWVLKALEKYGVKRTIAIKKGKQNYACRYDFENKRENLFKKAKDKGEVYRLESWLDEAAKGDHYGDLNEYPNPPDWIDDVRVVECDKDECSKCQMCGYFRNYQDVKSADVVVTNHTLVALEYMIPQQYGEGGDNMKNFLFGDRQALIFDEAHKLESTFENVWKDELNPFTLRNTLNKLKDIFQQGSPHKEGKETILRAVGEEDYEVEIQRGCSYDGMLDIGVYDPVLGRNLRKTLSLLGNKCRMGNNDSFVINKEDLPRYEKYLVTALTYMTEIREGIDTYVRDLVGEAGNVTSSMKEEAKQELRRVHRLFNRLESWEDLLESWLDMAPNHVYYVKMHQSDKGAKSYSLIKQPVNMARVLKPLWESTPSVIFSSATMSKMSRGRRSFNLFQSRLGTSVPDKNCIAVESPFNYKKRCATYITKDKGLTPPKYNASSLKRERYYDKMAKEIEYWTKLTRGNALVLFASAKDLEAVYNRVSIPYPVHAQMNDTTPANVVFRRYMKDAKDMCKRVPREGPVLFGLQSFWEGVSIKGPYLLNVILTRMPFPVPSNPLFKKREEELGKHAFPVLSLYPVSISARQGTGRLLRTRKDAGIVAILDERVGSRRWGASIIRELEVTANQFYDKESMEKTWGMIDRYMNKMLEKTNL